MKRIGFGQVEPNHLSAQRNGKIYAQLPAHADIEVLENGMFAKYDYENNCVNFTGEGEWMLVYNEVKTYEDRESYKDFAMRAENAYGGVMVPRLFKTDIGDIFTTNCLVADVDFDSVTVGMKLAPNANGYLAEAGESAEMIWKVVKVYTMPDGQPGVKVQRIK
jgi:hypothetical protein